MTKLKDQLFNIKVDGQCDSCKYGKVSDLFHEWMCDEPSDSVILYPENTGSITCPYFESEE